MKHRKKNRGIKVLGLVLLTGIIMASTYPYICMNDKKEYSSSKNFKDGKFINQSPVSLNMSFKDMVDSAKKYFSPDDEASPKEVLPVSKVDLSILANSDIKEPQIVWYGHSTFFIRMNGKNLLIDPMLGEVPAPKSWLGKPRFSKDLPLNADELPYLDAVIISHDHYDHLDKETIKQIKDKVDVFYTPLGVSKYLEEWGVASELINELDWWDQIQFEDLTFTCAPAQHFSGRGISDRQSTLWCSWIIASSEYKIFFSGDSGYNTHFTEIGEKFGPFDIALMECGQYNEKWADIHMFPEQTIQAAIDIKAKVVMPIHWGGFNLAEHTWKDPIERAVLKAHETKIPLVTPGIGEILTLNEEGFYKTKTWWRNY